MELFLYWATRFLAQPTLFSIKFCHPVREMRFPNRQRIGKKGKSNSRWIVGGKLCVILNKWELEVAWQATTANVSDSEFSDFLKEFAEQMIIFADGGFHNQEGDPENVKTCERAS
nr:hypothetical protein [uncultured bacterium]